MSTLFATVYNRFLGKVTDDMYLELTPDDTLRDMHNLLMDAIPGFEFPRKNLNDFINVINSSEFCKVDFNVVYEEKLNYEPLKITDNLEKIQFFKCKSGDKQKEYDLIIVKNKMQEHFKSAIRKSIKRYIPANSVLWKIQYSGK